MRATEELKINKDLFEAHAGACDRCSQYDGSTGTLRHLCWEGTQQFLKILESQKRVAKEKSR